MERLPAQRETLFFRLALQSGRLPGMLGSIGRLLGRTRGMRTSCGYRIVISDPNEYIQHCVLSSGAYEPGIVRVLWAICRPGDIFFDVGGNIGHHSLVAASRGATVHAFEPVPRLASRLKENFELNHISSRLVLNVAAVGAEAGNATLYETTRMDDGSHSLISGIPAQAVTERKVEVTTLDDYARRNGCSPAAIKIDVEGYEARVLDGASAVLGARPAPFVVIETADRLADQIGESARSVLTRLDRLGYRLFRLDETSTLVEPTSAPSARGDLANYLAAHPANPRTEAVIQALVKGDGQSGGPR